MTLKEEVFECIKENNSNEENNKQWEHSKIIFSEFEKYLRNNNKSDDHIHHQVGYCIFFIMNYFFTYDKYFSILDSDEKTIRQFLGNWYIRKSMPPILNEIMEIASALNDFFTFLHHLELIPSDQYEELIKVCTDREWFDKRIKSFKIAKDDKIKQWISEYNYE